jgi:AICAR transformylase/IMP cyclohydrolase PurH
VLVVVDPQDYPVLIEFLKGDGDDLEFRTRLASKAFQHSSSYDSAISEWLSSGSSSFSNFDLQIFSPKRKRKEIQMLNLNIRCP